MFAQLSDSTYLHERASKRTVNHNKRR